MTTMNKIEQKENFAIFEKDDAFFVEAFDGREWWPMGTEPVSTLAEANEWLDECVRQAALSA